MAAISLIPRALNVESFVSSYPPTDSKFMTCVTGNGDRVFLRRRNLENLVTDNQSHYKDGNSSISLLNKSMVELVREAEELQVRYLAEKAMKSKATEMEIEPSSIEFLSLDNNDLWVDRYCPKTFSEVCILRVLFMSTF